MIKLNLIVILIIAVSLSMDTFSLSLAYGTLNLKKNKLFQLSLIVGVYHFIMPLLGDFFGLKILSMVPINSDLLVFLVLSVIGIEMIIESFKDNNTVKNMKIRELVIFGFAVSVDSFSIGIGLSSITSSIYISAFIFAIVSFIFTYVGLVIGKKISKIVGKMATLLGGLVLIIVGFFYLI